MNKYVSLTGKIALGALVLIQFIRPARNLSNDSTSDISKVYPVPAAVQAMLKTSCYDCHSNSTNYPWYANIQPVGLWLDDHVKEGKGELNFSEFATYKLPRQYHKLEEVSEQVHEGEMPLSSYTIIHKDAVLTPAQQAELVAWAEGIRDTLEAHYPMDSLVRPRPAGPPPGR